MVWMVLTATQAEGPPAAGAATIETTAAVEVTTEEVVAAFLAVWEEGKQIEDWEEVPPVQANPLFTE
jgi:hypothetical protein